MPKFVTISPTHVPGKKEQSWERFRDGQYVAIGWLGDLDLTGWSDEKIAAELEERQESGWVDGKHDLPRFVNHLAVGDIVAVTNVNHSILGIGKITSDYYPGAKPHETGNDKDTYTHFRSVRWLSTKKSSWRKLIREGEVGWEPRGALGKIWPQVPPYIWRALNLEAIEALDISLPNQTDAGEYHSGAGQGFQSSPERRRAVEDFSMTAASTHYASLGFVVTKKGKPYDLLCMNGTESLFVEVKGTETAGDFIILTRNEVKLSRSHPMELFIVSGIQVTADGNGQWMCSGGKNENRAALGSG